MKPSRTTVARIHAKPNYAYIEINGTNMAGRESKKLRTKTDTILNIVYLDDKNLALLGSMATLKSLVVAFNRKKGATDLRHELISNLPKNIKGDLVNLKVTGCLIKLMKQNQKG